MRAPGHWPTWLIAMKMVLVMAGLGLLVAWAQERLPGNGLVAHPAAVLVALLLNQAALWMAALRLKSTLAAFGVMLSPRQAMGIHLQSLFYFFFVPMSVGLEAARYIKIRRIDPGAASTRLLAALLLDRFLGLVAALLLAATLLPFVWPDALAIELHTSWLWLVAVGCFAGLAVLTRLPALRQRLAELATAAAAGGRHLPRLLSLSLAALFLVCLSLYTLALGARLPIEAMEITFAVSAGLLGMALPISLLGVTLGESALVGLLVLLGLGTEGAILLAAAAYCGRLLGAIQGGLIELWVDAASRSTASRLTDS